MRVRNIECQLAQGQIRRYLNGDPLSDVAVEQLEDHLSECPDCTEFFQDCKQELIDDRNESEIEEEVYAPAQTSASSEISAVPRFLIDAIRQKRETLDRVVKPVATHAVIQDVREAKPSLKSYSKPLAYSIGLAGVLIAMSTIMRDPSRVLGDRVETALPAANSAVIVPDASASAQGSNSTETKPEQPVAINVNQAANPPLTGEKPSETPDLNSVNPPSSPDSTSAKPTNTDSTPSSTVASVKPSPSRVTTTRRSTPSKPTSRRQKPIARPLIKAPASKSGIRIYDDGGNPISQR